VCTTERVRHAHTYDIGAPIVSYLLYPTYCAPISYYSITYISGRITHSVMYWDRDMSRATGESRVEEHKWPCPLLQAAWSRPDRAILQVLHLNRAWNNRYSRLRQLTHITQWFAQSGVSFSSMTFLTSLIPTGDLPLLCILMTLHDTIIDIVD
jgi:hypothetical protein